MGQVNSKVMKKYVLNIQNITKKITAYFLSITIRFRLTNHAFEESLIHDDAVRRLC